MKKIFFSAAVVALTLASCAKKEETATTTATSTEVHTPNPEARLASDSTNTDMATKPIVGDQAGTNLPASEGSASGTGTNGTTMAGGNPNNDVKNRTNSSAVNPINGVNTETSTSPANSNGGVNNGTATNGNGSVSNTPGTSSTPR